jgi:hypothetical protein
MSPVSAASNGSHVMKGMALMDIGLAAWISRA